MNDKIVEWRRIVDRQHDLINQRANVFLIINGLLLAAVSTTGIKHMPSLLSLFGIAINLSWYLLGDYSKKRYKYFYNTLLESESVLEVSDQIYTQIQNNAPKGDLLGKIKISSTDFLCTHLPLSMTAVWVFVLFIIIVFYRDRGKPHSSPLPHHRTYGSVYGGSAGQSRADSNSPADLPSFRES